MATKRKPVKDKPKSIDETLYIFSSGPFPNVENIFVDALVTTHTIGSLNGKKLDAKASFTIILEMRGFVFDEMTIVTKHTQEALTMACLTAPSDCFIGWVRKERDISDLSIFALSLIKLHHIDVVDVMEDWQDPLLSLHEICEKSIGFDKLARSNNKLLEKVGINLLKAESFAFAEFERRFRATM